MTVFNAHDTRSHRGVLASALTLALSFAVTPAAHAHIDVDMGGTHMSRVAGGFDIKTAPCGAADVARGANVYKYRPGSTINISVRETIPHPGYFRISFDDDGTDDFVIPKGTAGEFGDCGGNASCGPGKEDYCSNETVLLDNLDPHKADAQKTYTWSVKLPDIECSNCTLQIIQMMNDFAPFHSPATYPQDDIYYHCIDIELSKDAPETNDMPVENNGMTCKRDGGAAEMPSDMKPAMGTAGAGGSAATGAGGGGSKAAEAGAGGSKASSPQSGSTTTGGSKAPTATAGSGGSAAMSGSGGSSGSSMAGADSDETESESSDGGCSVGTRSSGWLGPVALVWFALKRRRRTSGAR